MKNLLILALMTLSSYALALECTGERRVLTNSGVDQSTHELKQMKYFPNKFTTEFKEVFFSVTENDDANFVVKISLGNEANLGTVGFTSPNLNGKFKQALVTPKATYLVKCSIYPTLEE